MLTLHFQRWFRRRRWQKLAVVLFLIALFVHPTVSALAQTTPSTPQVATTENTATASYSSSGTSLNTFSNTINTTVSLPLLDPLGNILGCDAQPLASYAGFSMALYEPDVSGLDIGSLVSLTRPEDRDIFPPGTVVPNADNINPFPLTSDGQYSFFLDESRGQTEAGKTYILVINPPENSRFNERRVLIEMLGVDRDSDLTSVVLSYKATSLDGQPISTDGETELTRSLEVRDAAFESLTFFTFALDSIICEPDQIGITKSADRATVQPGDLIVYQLNIRNQSTVGIQSISGVDTFPVGIEFMAESVSAQVGSRAVAVTASTSGNRVRFNLAETLGVGEVVDIIYAARVTPDAIRGSGINEASVSGRRVDNNFLVQDGPSQHRATVDPGILSDCGTLIGRVFEDKDFDGEQQPGEAGIPNAVIFLDDGNRVVTDADGLFSVQKVLPGRRVGTLDLSSLPGYTLAPNLNFKERNSTARLVNLPPGGLARMSFGVTPTFYEEEA